MCNANRVQANPSMCSSPKHGQNDKAKKKNRKSLIDIISAIQWFQSYRETNLWCEGILNKIMGTSYLPRATISRQDYDCDVKNKLIIGTKWAFGILLTTSPSQLQDPKIKCAPSHFQTSQLLEEGKKIKKFKFAQLPSSMLPVQCYSEKINICWKVQIDD